MYNKNSLEQLERLDMAFEAIKKDLFGRLHQVYRKQLFGNSEEEKTLRTVQKLLPNAAPVEPPKESERPEES